MFIKTENFFRIFFLALIFIIMLVFLIFPRDQVRIIYQSNPEIGDEIVVKFKEKISEEKAKRLFAISPQVDGELVWLDEYNELHFLPEDGFLSGQKYTARIQGSQHWLLAAIFKPGIKKTFQPKGLPVSRLVRVQGENEIYYITESGLRRQMPGDSTHLSYPNGSNMEIYIIDRQTLDLYPDNNLIHLDNRPEVYKLEGGKKRQIKNSEIFNRLGLDWEAIAPVNQTEFAAYPEDEPISQVFSSQVSRQGKFVEIDLSAMKIYLFKDSELIASYPVAGKGNPRFTPTRPGLFSIKRKKENLFSNLSHVWMPWSMQYSGAYFIHEWPYWPGGARIKSKYSAGCIRLFEGDAKKVFDFAEIGTPVLVH